MKIFFISRGWPSEREPQWGCFERDQALALKKLGHEIVVLSVDARFRRYYRKYGITREVHDGITHYNLYAGFGGEEPLGLFRYQCMHILEGVYYIIFIIRCSNKRGSQIYCIHTTCGARQWP